MFVHDYDLKGYKDTSSAKHSTSTMNCGLLPANLYIHLLEEENEAELHNSFQRVGEVLKYNLYIRTYRKIKLCVGIVDIRFSL